MNRRALRKCLRFSQKCWEQQKHPEQGLSSCHFSFIVQKNKVLGHGFNRNGQPLTCLGYPASGNRHSETEAFRRVKALIDFKFPYEMVNIRFGHAGEIRLAYPCDVCNNFLLASGCNAVYFTSCGAFRRLLIEDERPIPPEYTYDQNKIFRDRQYSYDPYMCKIVWEPDQNLCLGP